MKHLYLLALFLTTALALHAQWNLDPKINTPVATGAELMDLGGHYNNPPPICRLPDGNIFIFWRLGPSKNSSLSVQSFDLAGNKRFGANGKNIIEKYNEGVCTYISADTLGNIFICWINKIDSLTLRLFCQKINTDGDKMWGSEGVLVSEYEGPNIATTQIMNSDNSGGCIIAWYDYEYPPILRVQRLDKDGELCWGAMGAIISNDSIARATSTRIDNFIQDGNGGYYITYSGNMAGTRIATISRLDSLGNVLWKKRSSEFRVDNYGLAVDGNGNAFVSYSYKVSWITYPYHVYQDHVFILKYDRDGNALLSNSMGNEVVDSLFLPASGWAPDVHSDSKGGVFLKWQQFDTCLYCSNGNLSKLYMQHVNAQGLPTWGNKGAFIAEIVDSLNANSKFSSNYSSDFIPDGSGGVIVFWASGWPDCTKPSNIYAQRLDSTGKRLWTQDTKGLPICTADSAQYQPYGIADGKGGAVIAWDDERNGSMDKAGILNIYCTRIDSTGTPFPVELMSFTANLQINCVHLDWRTASEMNNEGFVIERAANEDGPWEQIGFQTGHGSTAQSHDYSYNDPLTPALKSLPIVYYRLRQRDYDGTEHLSRIAEVRISAPQSVELYEPYPNPVAQKSVISFSIPSAGQATLSMYDVLGRCVKILMDEQKQPGKYDVPLDFGSLQSGLYFIRLDAPGAQIAQKVCVLK